MHIWIEARLSYLATLNAVQERITHCLRLQLCNEDTIRSVLFDLQEETPQHREYLETFTFGKQITTRCYKNKDGREYPVILCGLLPVGSEKSIDTVVVQTKSIGYAYSNPIIPKEL